jgi:DNA-binding HxlR family transcriptional regulator
MDEVTDRGKRVIRRDVIAREYGLSPRQSRAVWHLLESPDMRIEDMEALCPGVTRRTLQRDLHGLVKAGVLKVAGAARSVCYKLRVRGL